MEKRFVLNAKKIKETVDAIGTYGLAADFLSGWTEIHEKTIRINESQTEKMASRHLCRSHRCFL